MTEAERQQLNNFEARVRHLMYVHDELKLQHAQLKKILEDKEHNINQLKNELLELNQKYTNLRNAMTISLDGADVKKTRDELSKLVREVDACISMLINE